MSIFDHISDAYRDGLDSQSIFSLYQELEDKHTFDFYGRNLIHLACSYGDKDVIQYLIQEGVDVTHLDNDNNTALHALAKLNRDVKVEDDAIHDCAHLLLDEGVSIMRKNTSLNTCYLIAAKEGNYALIQVLIEEDKKLKATDMNGRNVLHLSVIGALENEGTLAYPRQKMNELQAANKEPDKFTKENYERLSLKEDHFFSLIRDLMDYGIDGEDKDNEGKTPLDYAKARNHTHIISILLNSNEEEAKSIEKTGGMTLLEAAYKGNVEAMTALIQEGADMNMVGDEVPYLNFTPLSLYAMKVDIDGMKCLIDLGCDVNFKESINERTAFANFIQYSRHNMMGDLDKIEDIIRLFINSGVHVDDSITKDLDTALILACQSYQRMRDPRRLIESFSIKHLLKAKADVNKKNKFGQSALMKLAQETSMLDENDLISLLENDADVNASDINGTTVLMYAAQNRNHAIANTFVDNLFEVGDVDIEAVDNLGHSALHYATEQDNEALVKKILMAS